MQRLIALEATIKVQNSAINKGNDDMQKLEAQNESLHSSDKENKRVIALLSEKNDHLSKEIISLKTEMSNEIMTLKTEIVKHKDCTILSGSSSKEIQVEVPSNDSCNEVVQNQDDSDELQQVRILKNFKDSGYLRGTPQEESQKKKLKCTF